MHKILNHCAEIRRLATIALRHTLHGTGTVLIGAGTAVVITGDLLQYCARRLRPAARHTVTQPAH